ncbi:MAG: hypothetical protein ABGX27_01400 [Desulfurobacteriaceae bacterium]
MNCSCRGGKSRKHIETQEIQALFRFLKKNPKLFPFVVDLIYTFRPVDKDITRMERVFLTVREIQELGLLKFSESQEFFRILKKFFLNGTDKQRGNFLEILVSAFGPFTFSEKAKRVNQCRMFKKSKNISGKEIDVAFSSKNYLELHECKSNMVRQWRDPLSKRTKKGSKLHFLDNLPKECNNGKKVIPCCTGLDGELTSSYIRKVFRFYRFKNIKVIGRKELFEKFKKKL